MIHDIETIAILNTTIKDQNKMLLDYGVELNACKEENKNWCIRNHQESFIEGLEWALGFVGREDLGITQEDLIALIEGKINEIEAEL